MDSTLDVREWRSLLEGKEHKLRRLDEKVIYRLNGIHGHITHTHTCISFFDDHRIIIEPIDEWPWVGGIAGGVSAAVAGCQASPRTGGARACTRTRT